MDALILVKQLKVLRNVTTNKEMEALVGALIEYFKEQQKIGISNG